MTKEQEYNQIVSYIQQKLQDHVKDYCGIVDAVDIRVVEALQEKLPYSSYIESISKTKGKNKGIHYSAFFTEDWKKFWSTWPSTKSVPGTQYKSGAKMKGAELKMHEKWYNAIESEKITVEHMQYAAECYLQWAYEDSKRLGRNELQYRNGMEPWFNQEQYLLFMTVEKPKVQKQEAVHTTAVDM